MDNDVEQPVVGTDEVDMGERTKGKEDKGKPGEEEISYEEAKWWVKEVTKGLFTRKNLTYLFIMVCLFALAFLMGYSLGNTNTLIYCAEKYKDAIILSTT